MRWLERGLFLFACVGLGVAAGAIVVAYPDGLRQVLAVLLTTVALFMVCLTWEMATGPEVAET